MTSDSKEPIGRLIYMTSLNLRNYAEKMLSPYDLTLEQYHLLKNTSCASGLSQNQLCGKLGKKPSNITRILDRLENKNWIERVLNPEDRRSSLVFLTKEGERMLGMVSNDFDGNANRVTEGISEEEERIVRSVLTKIDGNIKGLMREINK